MSKPDMDVDYLASVLRQAVRNEIRVVAVLDQPDVLSAPPCTDRNAEDGLIAAAREGHLVEMDPRDFSQPLHATLWVMLVEARSIGTPVTVDTVCAVLAKDGYVGGGLREEVERLFDHVPIHKPTEQSKRVARCARLRRVSSMALQLDAMTRTGGGDEDMRELANQIVQELSK